MLVLPQGALSPPVSLPDGQACLRARWVSPSARSGEEPLQKSTPGRQARGRLPALHFTSASPRLNKAELRGVLPLLVLETASVFMGGKCNVFFHHGLWHCPRVGRVNKISDSANVLKQKVL